MRKPALLAVAALLGATSLMGPAAFADDSVQPPADDTVVSTETAPEVPEGETAPAEPGTEPAPSPAGEDSAEGAETQDAGTTDETTGGTTDEGTDDGAADDGASDDGATDEAATDDGATTVTEPETTTDEPEAEVAVPSSIVSITLSECVLNVQVKVGDDAATVVVVKTGDIVAQGDISEFAPGAVVDAPFTVWGPLESPFEVRILDAEGAILASDSYAFDSERLAAECPVPDEDDDANEDDAPIVTGPSSIQKVTRDVCEVSIVVEHGDGQQKYVEIWDDRQLVEELTVWGSEDRLSIVTWTITKDFLTGAPGVDIVLYGEDGAQLDVVEEWDFPGSSDISRACTLSGGKSDKLPQKPEKAKKATGLPATGN